jgi:adenine-specific DNA-methyltransferase
MAQNKLQKLELTWIGKGEEPKLEPRILIEQPEYSYWAGKDEGRACNPELVSGMLIHGDNLLALKALEQDYSNKIKCIYIDPPYNTGSAFEHYDDGIEHSLWLSLIKPRLDILKKLLHKNGSIWISIDDTEYAYLRVLLDEIFGRNNFIATIIWEKRKTRENRRVFSFKHDYVVVYAKDRKCFEETRNPLILNQEVLNRYKNPDNDKRGLWQSISALAQSGHGTATQFYTLVAPNGKLHTLPKGNCWRYTQRRMEEAIFDNRIWFGKEGNGVPRIKKYLNESEDTGLTPETIWYADDVGTTDTAKKHILDIFHGQSVFVTPKPEELIQRIFQIASNKNEIVLDSFLGSGTTAAVAHKMGRRWIGVELGEHAKTHCFPRMKQVVEGEQGGISKSVNWSGGGGFKFYTLAPSLLNQDKFGNWVISSEYNAQMLAAATAKQEGFRYQPHETLYWKQGYSSEHDYIFTTTQFITVETLDQIHDEMLPGESLMICCKAFQKECKSKFANITIKKIPQMLLGRCEFGKDDYSHNIVNMPVDEEFETIEFPEQDIKTTKTQPVKKDKRSVQEINRLSNNQPSLFD